MPSVRWRWPKPSRRLELRERRRRRIAHHATLLAREREARDHLILLPLAYECETGPGRLIADTVEPADRGLVGRMAGPQHQWLLYSELFAQTQADHAVEHDDDVLLVERFRKQAGLVRDEVDAVMSTRLRRAVDHGDGMAEPLQFAREVAKPRLTAAERLMQRGF